MPGIPALDPPYESATGDLLNSMMPGSTPPILLFRTLAQNLPMTSALTGWGGYELSDRMSLSLRDREIIILRTCALCACEYEWAVHVAFFADRAEFGHDEVQSLPMDRTATPAGPQRGIELSLPLQTASTDLRSLTTISIDTWRRCSQMPNCST